MHAEMKAVILLERKFMYSLVKEQLREANISWNGGRLTTQGCLILPGWRKDVSVCLQHLSQQSKCSQRVAKLSTNYADHSSQLMWMH